jgi:uncharacterized membrane protein YkvA (DUF1232 family)
VFSDPRDRLRSAARRMKQELGALAGAMRDPRTPWFARALASVVLAYAASPIDLIPDFIPVLGLLDDLILVPLGIWLVLRLVPADVMAEHRARAAILDPRLARSGLAIMVAIWLASAALLWWWLR